MHAGSILAANSEIYGAAQKLLASVK